MVPNLHHIILALFLQGLEFTGEQLGLQIRRPEEQVYYDENLKRVLAVIQPSITKLSEGWARSFYTVAGHIASILSYSRDIRKKPTNPSMQAVDDESKRLFNSFPRVEAMDFETQLKDVPFESSSAAGYGYVGSKGENENHKRAVRTANATVREMADIIKTEGVQEGILNWLNRTVPDIAFTRTQMTYIPEKLKIRNVWGEAFHFILLEGLFAYPLMKYFSTVNTFFAVGFDPVIQVPIILMHLATKGKILTCDWSNFDATVQPWEIDNAFDLIKSMLIFPNEITEIAFEVCRLFFIHRKIVGPDGKVYFKHLGVPSGSYFTMLVDTIINMRRIQYVVHRAIGRLPDEVKAQGDDSASAISEPGELTPYQLLPHAQEQGWDFNPSKTDFSNDFESLEFLGRGAQGGYSRRGREKVLLLSLLTEYPMPPNRGDISAARAHALALDAAGRIPELNSTYLKLKAMYGETPIEMIPKEFRPYNPLELAHRNV